VNRVYENSPAEKAGLKQRDVIMEFDGEIIPDSASLPPVVGTTPVGSASKVTILRDGKRVTLPITIEALPDEENLASLDGGQPPIEDLGELNLKLRPLTPEELADFEVDSGLYVEGVVRGPAEEAGIVPGDVLVSIKNTELDSVATLNELIEKHDQSKPLDVLVKRGSGYLFLVINFKNEL